MAARRKFSAPGEYRTPVTPAGITFANLVFSEPRRYPRIGGAFLVPSDQGLYVILTLGQDTCPRRFDVLYFGETRNLQQRLTVDHEKYPEWMRKCTGGHLFFAYHPTPGLTYEQRREAERQLIEEYRPPCNVRVDTRSSFRALCWTRTVPERIQ